jgi:chromosomal replication initiator protein
MQSSVSYIDCKSAKDVMALAKEVREKRMRGYAGNSMIALNVEERIKHANISRNVDLNEICRELCVKFDVHFEPRKDINVTDVLSLIHEAWSRVHQPSVALNDYSIKYIQRAVSLASHVPLQDILSMRREARLVRPRHIAMLLCRVLSRARSLPEIGRMFNDRDHTTILHAVQKLAPVEIAIRPLVEAKAPLSTIIQRAFDAYDQME